MEGLLIVIALILGVIALSRTKALREKTERLQDELDSYAARLAALESGKKEPRIVPAPVVEREVRKVPEVIDEPIPQAEPVVVDRVPDHHEPIAPTPAAENPFRWFVEGNPLAKLGVLLMFFGVAYLLRYVSEHDLLSIEVRLAGAGLIALVLLAIGWRLRLRAPVYALTLQGGAVGTFYFTCFAAFRLYGVLGGGLVFALMIVICATSVLLAVAQRSQTLAMLGSLGGYLAPILLSTGGGHHVALFSYYTLLSLGILVVSVWRVWRPLNLIGFAFTFGVGGMWGERSYVPELYASTQPFLIVNLLIYGVLAAFASQRAPVDARDPARDVVDGTLVFGTPLIGFGLQYGLTQHWRYGPALSALAFATFYMPLARFTIARDRDRARLLALSFLVLGVGFATLAIPLALSVQWTSLAWAFEGLGMLWLGRRQNRAALRWTGTALLLAAAYTAWMAMIGALHTPTFLFLTSAMGITWMAAGRLWHGAPVDAAIVVSRLMLIGGLVFWTTFIIGGANRIWGDVPMGLSMMLVGGIISAVTWEWLGRRLSWHELAESAVWLWLLTGFLVLEMLVLPINYMSDLRVTATLVATLVTLWFIMRSARSRPSSFLRPLQHAWFWWLIVIIADRQTSWQVNRLGWAMDEWRVAAHLVVSSTVLAVLWALARRQHWSIANHPQATLIAGALPALALVSHNLSWGNLLDGRMPDQPYVPILNPLEEAAAFGLIALMAWRGAVAVRWARELSTVVTAFVLALLIWWVNGLLLRTLSMVFEVPWSLMSLWDSTTIQASMAIAWTVAALVAMAVGAGRGLRQLWFAGAFALAAVVVKLFLVDSARGGGIARAVAFISVAALVLVIGYLAPLPPRLPKEETPS